MDGRTWQWRTGSADDLPFIQDGECAYILQREPAHEAAWLGAVDRNDRLWSANLERTTLAVVGGTPVAYGMWALLDGVASVVTSARPSGGHQRETPGRPAHFDRETLFANVTHWPWFWNGAPALSVYCR